MSASSVQLLRQPWRLSKQMLKLFSVFRTVEHVYELLIKTNYLEAHSKHTKSLLNEIEEIVKLLTSIVKSSQNDSKLNT